MIVDLSVVVDAATLGPPAAGSPPVVLETAFRGPGHWQSSRIAALLHTGSHVDAPLHVVAAPGPAVAVARTLVKDVARASSARSRMPWRSTPGRKHGRVLAVRSPLTRVSVPGKP